MACKSLVMSWSGVTSKFSLPYVNLEKAKALINGLKSEGRKLTMDDRTHLAYAMLEIEVKDESLSLRPKVIGVITEILAEFQTMLNDPGNRTSVSYSELPTIRRVKRKIVAAHTVWTMSDPSYSNKLADLHEILAIRYCNGNKLPETIGGYLVSMGAVHLLAVQRGFPIISTTSTSYAERSQSMRRVTTL